MFSIAQLILMLKLLFCCFCGFYCFISWHSLDFIVFMLNVVVPCIQDFFNFNPILGSIVDFGVAVNVKMNEWMNE